jgi:hypothetical protein
MPGGRGRMIGAPIAAVEIGLETAVFPAAADPAAPVRLGEEADLLAVAHVAAVPGDRPAWDHAGVLGAAAEGDDGADS